jgi:transcriptional regulator with XRE-family HTH domain
MRSSVRTIQRIECGEAPSAETLRLIADALEVPVAEMGQCAGRNVFRSPYFTQKWRYFMLAFSIVMMAFLLVFIVANVVDLPPVVQDLRARFLHRLCLQPPFGYVTGLSVKDGKLLIHHPGWAKKIDLAKLTGIEICPEMLGAFPLTFLFGWNFSAPFYAASLGVFRNYGTNADTGVLLEFGKRKIVVTPDDRDAFVDAVRRVARGRGGTRRGGEPALLPRASAPSAAQKELDAGKTLRKRRASPSAPSSALECGTQPSTDTLRILAQLFELDVADFLAAAKSAKTRFRATYSKSMIRTFTVMVVIFILFPSPASSWKKVGAHRLPRRHGLLPVVHAPLHREHADDGELLHDQGRQTRHPALPPQEKLRSSRSHGHRGLSARR